MHLRILTVLLVTSLLGCASEEARKRPVGLVDTASAVVSFCNIAERPQDFVRVEIRTQATYRTVKYADSYFASDECEGKSALGEGNRRSADQTLTTFDQAGDRLCKIRKIESLCVLEAKMLVDVRIRLSDEGTYVVDPTHVESYEYLPAETGRTSKPQ